MTLVVKGNLSQPNLPDVVPLEWIMENVRIQVQRPPDPVNPFLNRLMILEAKTASGKSASIPPAMYILFDKMGKLKKILCTQPKVLTTISTTLDIEAKNLFVPKYGQKFVIGENLTYQTKAARTERLSRGLRVVTLGTLAAELIRASNNPSSSICDEYNCIIIDEAHERSVEFDTTILYLKRYYEANRQNPDLPFLILMSATFDTEKYGRFFEVPEANIVKVSGRSFEIEHRFLTFTAQDWQKEAFNVALSCVEENIRKYLALGQTDIKSADRILIFVPGVGEADTIKKHFQQYKDGKVMIVKGQKVLVTLQVAFIDSKAQRTRNEDYTLIFGAEEHTVRYSNQIIMSTNVAETGLTLPDLTYVIDSGWARSTEFDPTHNISPFLSSKPAELSRVIQRRGRSGRVKPGVFCPLYTEETFNKLQKLQYPDIFKSDASNMLLLILQLFDGVPENINKYLLDAPPKQSINYSIVKLRALGLIEDLKLTPLGRIACMLERIKPETVVSCLACTFWNCPVDDMLASIIMTECVNGAESPFAMPKSQRKVPNLKQWEELFEVCYGKSQDCYYRFKLQTADQLLLNLIAFRAFGIIFEQLKLKYNGINLIKQLQEWTAKVGINYRYMVEAYARYEDERNQMVRAGINMLHGWSERLHMRNDWPQYATAFKMSLYCGYKLNVATLSNEQYVIEWGRLPVRYSFFDDEVGGWERFEANKEYQPERILSLSYGLKSNRSTNIYSARAQGVSVLSGFI